MGSLTFTRVDCCNRISLQNRCSLRIVSSRLRNFGLNLVNNDWPAEVFRVSLAELVYDWNTIDPALKPPNRHISFDDETLRDGLQSP